jgi:hypothetical protein
MGVVGVMFACDAGIAIPRAAAAGAGDKIIDCRL